MNGNIMILVIGFIAAIGLASIVGEVRAKAQVKIACLQNNTADQCSALVNR